MLETCPDGVCVLPAGLPAPAASDQPFHAAIRDASLPVLVDCFIADCGPCEALSLVLPKLEGDFAGRLQVIRLDADAEAVLKSQYGVDTFPTLLAFHRGAVVRRRVGFQLTDHGALRGWIADFLAEATGVAAPPSAAEPAFEQALAAALDAHDAVIMPLLDAAIAAQEPLLPGHNAAVAQVRAARAAGEIDAAEAERRVAELGTRLRAAIGEPARRLTEANLTAGPALEDAIARATAAFLAAPK